jgi:hypothetical protein
LSRDTPNPTYTIFNKPSTPLLLPYHRSLPIAGAWRFFLQQIPAMAEFDPVTLNVFISVVLTNPLDLMFDDLHIFTSWI